jgi:cellulose synthase/poly-beta-1,6-N-acetylglucosamine synthase-like glycosyltransferase
MVNVSLLLAGLLYLLITATLFVFGLNFIYLSHRARQECKSNRPNDLSKQSDVVQWPDGTEWPAVTVQLPIYNEMYVAERVIRAAARLEYPAELLQIQVLDDSTDETSEIVGRVVAQLRKAGVNIDHLHRTDRAGFKAGALQAGMASANGEFMAIFDADFVPPTDFLRRALPYLADPGVAFVQTRWGHLNPDYSWLTFLQSLAIDAHFVVEQFARSRAGYWFNFNGTAGIWRRKALEEAGGWTADTLTEDLDLSYRAYLLGWRGHYVRDIVVPAELPPNFSAFRDQQHRWARGSLECARKLLPQVWRAPIPFSHKLQASLHLGGYSVHLLLFGLTLIYPLVALFNANYPQLSSLYGLAYLFGLSSIAPTLFFIVGQEQLGRPWWKLLPKILAISVVGSGLMVNTVRAAWQIWRKPHGVFKRTAKFGIEQKAQDWTRKRYQLRFDPIVYPELALGGYCLVTAWLAATLQSWGIVFYSLLFGSGLIVAATVTIVQSVAVYRGRKGRAKRGQGDLGSADEGVIYESGACEAIGG